MRCSGVEILGHSIDLEMNSVDTTFCRRAALHEIYGLCFQYMSIINLI